MIRNGDKIKLAKNEKDHLSELAGVEVNPGTVADYNATLDHIANSCDEGTPEERLLKAVAKQMKVE